MSHSDPSEPIAVKQSHSPISRIEHGVETLVFPSLWIQSLTLRGLIMAELLYAYKFLVELWEMVRHINQQEETSHAGRPRADRRHDGGELARDGGNRRLRHLREQIGVSGPSRSTRMADTH